MEVDLQLIVLLAPIVAALVEILKQAGVKRTLAPIFALAVGVMLAIGFGVDEGWTWRIVTGLAIGAAASGFYDYTKALFERVK